jgi:glycosyltransferase involved in cell wall biosynthesis
MLRPPLDVPIVMYLDADQRGGAAPYFVQLGSGLRRRGYRVVAICNSAEQVAPMRDALIMAGVDVRVSEDSDFSVRGRVRRVLTFLSIVREHPGCVLALMMGYHYGGGPVALAGILGRAGAIVRADLQPPLPPVPNWDRISVGAKDLLVSHLIVGAHDNVEANVRLLGRARNKHRVVHTGIDLAKYRPGEGRADLRTEFGYSGDTKVVGMISRLGQDWWRKGVSEFLEMAVQVSTAVPNTAFLIVGDGLHRAELEQRAATLGLGTRITFAGWRGDIPALLAGMDVFVMPSLYEGGPTIVLEAMAMARPVVATSVGMVPEVMQDDRSGLIVAPGDSRALAHAVNRLLADPELCRRLGEHARAQAEASFSTETMVDRYLEVFAQALAPRQALMAAPRSA